MSEKPFLRRVRDHLDEMHPAERRLAGFILNFPGELAAYSAQELAALAGVSGPTVSRFIKRLGYVNFEAARRHARAGQKGGAALNMVALTSVEPEGRLAAHIDQARANLEKTFLTIPISEIDDIARGILRARRVWIVGFRTSHALATYLYWQTYQVCGTIEVIPQAGQTMSEHIAAIRAEDLIVVIGMARRIRSMDRILAALVRTGARIAYLADEALEPQAGVTWHLRCATAAPGPLFSHVSVMLVVQMIATRTIEVSGPEGHKRLSAIEALHETLDEL